MIPEIVIKIDDARSIAALDRVNRIQAGAPVLMRQIAGIMHTEVEDNFEAQGRPRWAPLKPSSLESKYRREAVTRKGLARRDNISRFQNAVRGNKILQASGSLASSVVMFSSATQAIVGANKVYAAIHQFGGKTKPHVIRARRKKALAFGGIMRKSVNHPGSVIPARPYLALGPEGGTRIKSADINYLRNLIKP
ncbi:MAG: phage virion morphogenesis protein [Burkholderiales bacterium]